MTDYSDIALHRVEEPFDPRSLRIGPTYPMMTTGSRCELTQRVRIPHTGAIYEVGHPGLVIKGQCTRTCCWSGMRFNEPYIVALDGANGFFKCDFIRPSDRELEA